MKPYYNEYLNLYRLALPDMAYFLYGMQFTRRERAALKDRALELGAWYVGKAMVIQPNGNKTQKDAVYAVEADNWETWCEAMRATPLETFANHIEEKRAPNWKPGTWAVLTVESHITTDPAEADAARRAGKIVRKLA